jgi:cytochrome c-type biogenesis protein CcmF
MFPELGQIALILALLLAVLLSVVPLVGSLTGREQLQAFARPLASGMFVFIAMAFGLLVHAFLTDDFSVAYVANNSNSLLPWFYKFSAVWGGHEGSLLLWILLLSGWTLAVAIFSRRLPAVMISQVLSVMGMICVGFLLFIILTSNPFDRLLPNIPADGADLNPLLQDIGLIMHPPMLYMGYVGFSVAFAFAIAALINGRLDAAWARWSRPWTTVAWAFLSVGIALGSWWAYYELGWGGWWFWDPVENASFMPWLVGTALIHSLAVTEKRGVFKSWTVLLAIFAFSLSLLGTFLVRSGVLTSVHAFASDPDRGFFILALLAITIGGSLLLYAIKAAHVKAESSFELVSRESFLLMNNILLVVVALMVLLGTLYPLLMDALQKGKMSVGAPYFNAMFVPLMSILVVLMGVGAISRWKATKVEFLAKQLWMPAILAIVVGTLVSLFGGIDFEWSALLGLILSFWVLFSGLRDVYNRVASKKQPLKALTKFSLSYYGMILAHAGVAVSIVGILMVSIYSEDRDMRMTPGDRQAFKHYEFVFDGARQVQGPNYRSDMGRIVVLQDGEVYTTLYPEKRLYNARGNVMTEAAIDPGLFRDLYVALGEPLENGAWAVRMQYKPFVRWIWLGGLLMTFGGLLSASDRRYRQKAKRQQPKAVSGEAEFA